MISKVLSRRFGVYEDCICYLVHNRKKRSITVLCHLPMPQVTLDYRWHAAKPTNWQANEFHGGIESVRYLNAVFSDVPGQQGCSFESRSGDERAGGQLNNRHLGSTKFLV